MVGSSLGRSRIACPRRAAIVVAVLTLSLLMFLVPGGGLPRTAPASGSGALPSASPTPARTIIIPQPTWINVTASGAGHAPPALWAASSAYDPALNETVEFGGCWDYNCSLVSNQTWVFASGAWTNVSSPHSAPPARYFAAMDYDANMKGVLLFGGTGLEGGMLNDTWLYRAGAWVNVTSYSAPPPAAYGATMAFDPEPEENGSVLFGGYGPDGYLNQTWVWQGGAGWVLLKSTSLEPPAVVYAATAYDAADGYLVLTGGYLSTGGDSGATWELYSGQWWAVSPASSPPPRSYGQMVYEPSLSGVLLFGGYSYETGYQDNQTWLFSSGDWTKRSPDTAPPCLDSVALALDGTGQTPVLLGGLNLTRAAGTNVTWAYEFAPGLESLTPSVAAPEVGENVTFTATVVEGTAPYSATFAFGDGSYATVSGPGPSLSTSHRYTSVGTFVASVTFTDAVGAKTASGTVDLTVGAGPAISAHALAPGADLGVAIGFVSSIVVQGTSPLTFAWTFGDGGTAATQNASHTYASTGTYTVSVVATDADHATSTVSFTVTVVADPTLKASATPSNPLKGAATSFYANVSGGTGPYTYTWRFDDSSSSALPDPVHRYNATGSYTVEVWANDSGGGSSHATFTVTVVSSSSSALGALASAPPWFWGGVGALAVAGAAGSWALVRRGRAPKP